MDVFFKAVSLILITVILSLFLEKWEKTFAILLSFIAFCIAGTAGIFYLKPVFSFLEDLHFIGQLQNELLSILIKAVGITFVTEIAGMFCHDAGNGTLNKILHLLSSGMILYLSIPIFTAVLNLITEIIGEL